MTVFFGYAVVQDLDYLFVLVHSAEMEGSCSAKTHPGCVGAGEGTEIAMRKGVRLVDEAVCETPTQRERAGFDSRGRTSPCGAGMGPSLRPGLATRRAGSRGAAR